MRDLQELFVESSHDHRRPLAEVHDLIEHLLGRVHMGPAALGLDLGNAGSDDLAAALLRKNAGGLKYLLVDGGLCHLVLTRPEHAMTTCGVRARYIGIMNGNDLGTQ